jgi:hypothetical protein
MGRGWRLAIPKNCGTENVKGMAFSHAEKTRHEM